MPLLQVLWDPSEEKHQHCLPRHRETSVVTAERSVIISWHAINILVVRIPAGLGGKRDLSSSDGREAHSLSRTLHAHKWQRVGVDLQWVSENQESVILTRARVPFFTRLSSVFVLKQRKRCLLSLFLKFYVHICLTSLLLTFYSRYSNMIFFFVPVILLFAYHNVAMILTNPFFKAILVGKTFKYRVFVIMRN